jgi:UDP-N-acetylglucosamine 4,6-dehydratase
MTLARAIAPECEPEVVGIRPGEKLHEMMIGEDDARRTLDMGDYYVVQPDFPWWENGRLTGGRAMPDGFSYQSDTNPVRLSVTEVRELLGRLGLLDA